MSAPAISLERGRLPRIRLRPAEGWLAVVMTALLAVAFAWSLDDAGWVPPLEGSTGYLVWLAVAAVVIEIVGAKAGWGRWRTHLVGVVIGGLLLPFLAGAIVLGIRAGGADLSDPASIYRTAGNVAFRVWADLARDGRAFTTEFGHYHMVFGAFVWAAGLLAGGAVFVRRRPLDAVVITGLLLLGSMVVTKRDQLQIIVVFSIAALVLLIRSHTFEEQMTWVRRRIGDPEAISALYLRGGGSFIAAAVFGALFLTATASSAPLQDWWSDLPQKLSGVADFLQRIAPSGGDPRGIGTVGFGSSASTNGLWQPQDVVAFRAQLGATELGDVKWRAGTYATFDGINRWSWGDTGSIARDPDTRVLVGIGDDPESMPGRREFHATVSLEKLNEASVLSPQALERIDKAALLRITGDRFTTVEVGGGTREYTITALVPTDEGPDAITENRLRAAGNSYPADVTRYYGKATVPEGTIGPESQAIIQEILLLAAEDQGGVSNPYDIVKTMETYLRSNRFNYTQDVRGAMKSRCGGVSTVECFAIIRSGYCEFYAGAMTMWLRQAGIPARIAYGFLPARTLVDGTQIVKASNAHWWVEVYFPGFGWMEFDPTGSVGQPTTTTFPSGPPVTPRPASQATIRPDDRETDPAAGSSRRPSQVGPGGGTTSGPGPFIVLAIVLILGVGTLAYAARRRAPRKPMDPDHAWGALGRLAGRLGFGPRPAQTVYEYAGMLGDAVPMVRAELTTVARAKVEVAYGRHELGLERLRGVGEAYRRLRLALLRFGILRRLGRRR